VGSHFSILFPYSKNIIFELQALDGNYIIYDRLELKAFLHMRSILKNDQILTPHYQQDGIS